MIDTSLRDMILAALAERTSWEAMRDRLLLRGHNESEINDVLQDLVFRGHILADEIPDCADEEMTWYEPKNLTPKGYEFIEANRLDLKNLMGLLFQLVRTGTGG